MKVWCDVCSRTDGFSWPFPVIVPLTPREKEAMENGTWLVPGLRCLNGEKSNIYYCPICGCLAEPVKNENLEFDY
jgi:hypothetical protein